MRYFFTILAYLCFNSIFSQIASLSELNKLIVIQPKYENAGSFNEGLGPVQLNGKYGYIDSLEKTVIPFDYDNAYDISNSIALVYKTDGYIYLNKQGKQIISSKYVDAYPFTESLAIVDKTGSAIYKVINTKGADFIAPKVDFIKPFLNGLAPVQKNGKWGYINKKGQLVIPAIYEAANTFSAGLAVVKKGGQWTIVDPKGKVILSTSYEKVGDCSENLFAVMQNNKWGFIDKAGKIVIPLSFDYVEKFNESIAPAKANGLWGYIDKSGKWIIKPILSVAKPFNDNIACIAIANGNDKLFGFIKNPLTLIIDTTKQNQQKNKNNENTTGQYKLCNEKVFGWQGNISNIHTIDEKSSSIKVKWIYKNNEFGIIIYEGKGLNGKVLFKEKKVKYTGEKEVKIKSKVKYITVQIIAKKEASEWEYKVECL